MTHAIQAGYGDWKCGAGSGLVISVGGLLTVALAADKNLPTTEKGALPHGQLCLLELSLNSLRRRTL